MVTVDRATLFPQIDLEGQLACFEKICKSWPKKPPKPNLALLENTLKAIKANHEPDGKCDILSADFGDPLTIFFRLLKRITADWRKTDGTVYQNRHLTEDNLRLRTGTEIEAFCPDLRPKTIPRLHLGDTPAYVYRLVPSLLLVTNLENEPKRVADYLHAVDLRHIATHVLPLPVMWYLVYTNGELLRNMEKFPELSLSIVIGGVVATLSHSTWEYSVELSLDPENPKQLNVDFITAYVPYQKPIEIGAGEIVEYCHKY